jgi:Rrf2 family transcriptional regulator, nitric oxide-sensitive transcriptional repressor
VHLTQFTNYALRTLMTAALRGSDLTRVQDVADGFGIARTHVVKCVHQLGTWGLLENVRGRHGGFRLARPADQIRVGDVVRLTEDSFCLVECFDPERNSCPVMDVCRLNVGLKRALAAFLAVLDDMTIADIVANADELAPRIGLDRMPVRGGKAA